MKEISVNPEAAEPAFAQIQNQVQFAIASGALSAGDQLPPVMRLAKETGVNLNTVSKAYRDLEIRGLIYARKGVGCFVANGAPETCKKEMRDYIYRRACVLAREAAMAGLAKKDLSAFIAAGYRAEGSPYSDPPPYRKPR